jgi:NADH-quinone oxidoreductase subunit J
MDLNFIAFIVMGIAASLLSGTMITRRRPVSAAMILIAVMTLLAGMFGLLEAHFAAAAQIIVYAGAIMVVFVFVIMLLNLPPEELRYGGITLGEIILIGVSVVLAVALGTQVGQGLLTRGMENMGLAIGQTPSNARTLYFPPEENVKNVAASMFVDYLWAFELVSFLILAAVIGAIVIAKKRSSQNATAS